MLLATPASHVPTRQPIDTREEQREARRELLLLLSAAVGLVLVAILLGRSPLGLAGPPHHLGSWSDGPPGLAALRVLRVLLLVGSVTFLSWLGLLAVMCVPRRAAASTRLARLPFNRLVRQALVGTVALALVGSSAGSALAGSRPAVVADDATGGQRWPDLPQQPRTTTPAPRATTPPTEADAAIVRIPTILPRLAAPTSSATSPPTSVSTVKPVETLPAGPSLALVFEPRFTASRSSIAARIPQATLRDSGETRVVRVGESFWSMAEDEVLTRVDEATDADIARYWRRLIETNRARLPDPTNPDLLWVGTTLALPSVDGSFGARVHPRDPLTRVGARLV